LKRSHPTALGVAFVLLVAASGTAQTAVPKKAETPPAKEAAPKAEARPAPPVVPASPLPKGPDEPRVLTTAEMDRRAKGSPFLAGPASDRYGEAVPWSEIPEWRRASFYGVRTVAQTVVYVVDCSGSMAEADRILRAKAELRRSVMGLQFPQRFTVIFYNQHPIPMPGIALKSAELATKDQFLAWLRMIEPDGGTEPRGALKIALSLNPDAIYLLSDGAFPNGVVEETAQRNTRKIPIHCIDLAGGSAGDHLRRIARDSGGQYASRP
jgi:von Willebrand factor type A domain